MSDLERYRNFKIRITESNYHKVVTWFNNVDPGSFIDFCVSKKDDSWIFCLWNEAGGLLKLESNEFIIGDGESRNIFYCLWLGLNQAYDTEGKTRWAYRYLDDKNLEALWKRFSESDFVANSDGFYSGNDKFANYRTKLRYYNDHVNELFSAEAYNEIPSKLFIMGDIGIYKVEEDVITISFDIRINVNNPEDVFVDKLIEFDTQNEVKPYEYRKAILDYLFSSINDINSVGNDYVYLEIPLMPQKRKLIGLLYMYFSAKGMFKFRIVDDLTMLNIYKRDNLLPEDFITPNSRRVCIGMMQGDYPHGIPSEYRIVPEDIVYTIDQPLEHAVLMTLLGKYSEGYSLDKGDYDNDRREIAICVINIERAAQHLAGITGKDYNYETIRGLLIKKVFCHELGHMIFRKVSPKQSEVERETTANWVACLSYDQINVEKIRYITYKLCKEQTEIYQKPLKIPDFINASTYQYNSYCNKLKKLLEK